MSDELECHPLADLFPVMEGADFDALVADIKANRLRDKIILYEGKILDGRNRYRALRALGVDPEAIREQCCRTIGCIDAHHGGPAAYVISANIHRRHLTAEQRRDLIVKVIKAQPQKSDRAIAKQIGVGNKTVSRARATVSGDTVEKRVGLDGKARRQPAKKASKPTARKDKARTEAPPAPRCSFCRKCQDEVELLIGGGGHFICNECVDLCVDIIRRRKEAAAPLNGPQPKEPAKPKAPTPPADDGLDIPGFLRR